MLRSDISFSSAVFVAASAAALFLSSSLSSLLLAVRSATIFCKAESTAEKSESEETIPTICCSMVAMRLFIVLISF